MDRVELYSVLPDLVAQCCPHVSVMAFPVSCALNTASRDCCLRASATARVFSFDDDECFSTRSWGAGERSEQKGGVRGRGWGGRASEESKKEG
jgi:hypothetical protein